MVAADHVLPESCDVLTAKVYTPASASTFVAANEMAVVVGFG